MTFPRLAQRLSLATVAAALSLYASNGAAAVPNNSMAQSPGLMQQTIEALELPMSERIQDLRAQKSAYQNLETIAFKKSNTMDLRWKAVTALGRLGGAKAKAELDRALKSPEWFMRNAALVSYSQVDRASALVWARKLLSDKALVVRSAAVDVIAGSRDVTSAPLLWQKLNSKENFKNRQSLFIRRRIVEALADLEGKGREAKFIAILQDKDESLHEPAIEALERITAKSMGSPGQSVQSRRAQWQQWWTENKTL